MRLSLTVLAIAFFAANSLGQDSRELRLVDNEIHIVTVSKKGSSVVFRMEAIADFTEDRDKSKPLGTGWDHAGIRVDIDNNNVIDKNVDVSFGIRQNTHIFCPQYLVEENVSTRCGGYSSKGTVQIGFIATDFQSNPHPVFVYTIPLAELNKKGGTIGLTFRFSDPPTGRVSYPDRRNPRSFDRTIQLDLSQL